MFGGCGGGGNCGCVWSSARGESYCVLREGFLVLAVGNLAASRQKLRRGSPAAWAVACFLEKGRDIHGTFSWVAFRALSQAAGVLELLKAGVIWMALVGSTFLGWRGLRGVCLGSCSCAGSPPSVSLLSHCLDSWLGQGRLGRCLLPMLLLAFRLWT